MKDGVMIKLILKLSLSTKQQFVYAIPKTERTAVAKKKSTNLESRALGETRARKTQTKRLKFFLINLLTCLFLSHTHILLILGISLPHNILKSTLFVFQRHT